jgi:nucleoside 2-deoxyribosyltransferase
MSGTTSVIITNMKKVFISYSFSKREDVRELHEKLKKLLEDKFNLEVYAFVFDYKDNVDDKKLMRDALQKVDEADCLIVELSNKSLGIGIEAGYANAKGKPIIYLNKRGTELKQTMKGIADVVITYEKEEDLLNQISNLELLQS